jgi:hypothetical protein
MYTEIYEHSSAFLESCYQRNNTMDNETDKNAENEVDCMPEPFEYKEGAETAAPIQSPHPSPYSKFY